MADADKILVKKILNGDLKAFRVLIEKSNRLVAHIVYRLINNPADQEEICQEIFIRIYQNLPDFKFKSKLSTWIGRIAYNTTINHLRKEKIPLFDDRQPNSPGRDGQKGESDSYTLIPDTRPAPDALLEKKDRGEMIERMLVRLPPPFRMILTLFHLEQMSYLEISELMDLPEGTVKSYLYRARKKLKEVLDKELEGEEI
jgi:RNA polymerase sigma-70 factor (ECF subfamily)